MRPLASLAILVALSAGLIILAGSAAVPADPERGDTIRGITISTHGIGREWADDAMIPTMRSIKGLGANWVTIHPYARIANDGTVSSYRRGSNQDAPPPHVVNPIRMAHELGIKILIKPHLAYWGSRFSWRGDIKFDDDASWDRFFSSYEKWIVSIAKAATDADGFAIGTELDATLAHDTRWKRIIERVRAVTKVPLTYAANWSDYTRVPFWPQLDVIGIQAYFPLSNEDAPKATTLRKAWSARMKELRTFSKKHQRPIVFTELGYNQSLNAHRRPWESKRDGTEAAPLQEACLRAALEAIESEPTVLGSFLWKWFPEPRPVGRNFRMALPRIQALIRSVWESAPPTSPPPEEAPPTSRPKQPR